MGKPAAKVKLWVETDGRLVMSDYRLRLLELIAETGSLAQAAGALGLSYRRAWGKLKEIEANLGTPLVESGAGGPGGGHTNLSPGAADLVRAYRAFRARSESAVAEAFEELLEPFVSGDDRPVASEHG